MTKQRSIYIEDDVWTEIRVRAVRANVSTSTYVAGILSGAVGAVSVTSGDSVTARVTEAVTKAPLNPLRGRLDDVEQPFERIRPTATVSANSGDAVIGGIVIHSPSEAALAATKAAEASGRTFTPVPKPTSPKKPARRR